MLFSMLKLAGRVQGDLARTNGLLHEHTSSPGRRAMMARSCVLLTLACALAGSANAQFVQQGGKLLGTGEVGNAELGNSVAVSSDGNTAIVGGPGDNGAYPIGVGAAWVFAVNTVPTLPQINAGGVVNNATRSTPGFTRRSCSTPPMWT